METLKTIPEFIEGIEEARKAKKGIETAREKLFEARKIRIGELHKQKKEIQEKIKQYEKELEEFPKQLNKFCSKSGHKMVFVSQRRISNKRGTHSFINPGYEYKITQKCVICGYTTTYKGKMTLERPEVKLSSKQKKFLAEYDSKMASCKKNLKEAKKELEKIDNKLAEICAFFGHEVETILDDSKYKRCVCCGEEFNIFGYSVYGKDINDYMLTPKDLIKF